MCQPGKLARGVCITLYNGSRPDQALTRRTTRLLQRAKPGIVQIHGGPRSLMGLDPAYPANKGIKAVVAEIRAMLPGVEIWIGVGCDGWLKGLRLKQCTKADVIHWFWLTAKYAAELGATWVIWDAEAEYKLLPKEGGKIARAVQEKVAVDFPILQQGFTSYDHPTYHSTFPWHGWIGPGTRCRRAWAQVYAAPGGEGVQAHVGALPRREVRALSSWKAAVKAGWIAEDVTPDTDDDLDWYPYIQAHSVPASDTIALCRKYDFVAFWAAPTRIDDAGETAIIAVCDDRVST